MLKCSWRILSYDFYILWIANEFLHSVSCVKTVWFLIDFSISISAQSVSKHWHRRTESLSGLVIERQTSWVHWLLHAPRMVKQSWTKSRMRVYKAHKLTLRQVSTLGSTIVLSVCAIRCAKLCSALWGTIAVISCLNIPFCTYRGVHRWFYLFLCQFCILSG